MIPKIAEAYENKNPGSKFEIALGAGCKSQLLGGLT